MGLTIQHIACRRCDAVLAVEIDQCPECGANTVANVPKPSATGTKTGNWDWIHRRRTLLFVLLCATGALGLPLLWMSRAFSTRAKLLWSIVVSAETALLVALCWLAVQMAIDAIEPLLS